MHDPDFDRHSDQLGKLVTLGLKWARVLQQDKGDPELSLVCWSRHLSLAAKVEGFFVSEAALKWVWDSIRTAPAPDSNLPDPSLTSPKSLTSASPRPENSPDNGNQSTPPPADGLSELSRTCFEALRRWRADKAKKLSYPAYVITRDPTLIELAKHRPTSLEELNAVPGISSGFSERYGDEVAQLLTDWCLENMEEFKPRPVISQNTDISEPKAQNETSDKDQGQLKAEKSIELDVESSIAVVTCQHCGIRLAPERLEIFPEAKYCVKCQETSEQNGDFIEAAPPICPRCERKRIHSELVYRRARDPEIKGYFLGCSKYPHCQYIDR